MAPYQIFIDIEPNRVSAISNDRILDSWPVIGILITDVFCCVFIAFSEYKRYYDPTEREKQRNPSFSYCRPFLSYRSDPAVISD